VPDGKVVVVVTDGGEFERVPPEQWVHQRGKEPEHEPAEREEERRGECVSPVGMHCDVIDSGLAGEGTPEETSRVGDRQY
jgi:hypothetical protein